jgi:hypothetical protein
MGALVIVLMQFLTGGAWGLAIRRLSEAAFMALPVIALLFAPILVGMHDLFPWSRPEAIQTPGSLHKHAYLNLPFFCGENHVLLRGSDRHGTAASTLVNSTG